MPKPGIINEAASALNKWANHRFHTRADSRQRPPLYGEERYVCQNAAFLADKWRKSCQISRFLLLASVLKKNAVWHSKKE